MSLNIIIDADVSSASQKISKFSYEVQKSFASINTVLEKTSTGFQYNANKLADSTKSFAKASQNSLTALSLTLQDLPFGFIGVQNNLPGIIQGFGQMSAEAKTGASVLSQLKGALLGPAGIYLAFSAVSAIVTKLAMDYGGLGNAIDALFGRYTKFNEVIKRANESFKEYNKSIITNNEISGQATASQNGQAISARALLASVLDLTKTEAERKNALDRLKKLDEERFKNFDIEKGKINGLQQAVEGYTRALIAQSVANKFVDQVSITSVELEKQRNALQELYNQADLLEKKYPNLAYEAEKYRKELILSQGRLGAGLVQPTKGVLDYIANFKKIGEQEVVIKGIVKELESLNTATISAVQSASALASPFKEVEKSATKAVKSITQRGELGPGSLIDTAAAFAAYVKGNINIQKASIDKILRDRTSYRRKELEAGIGVPKKIDKIAGAPMSKELEDLLGRFQLFQAGLAENLILLNQTFFQPLENAFMNLFETGKFGFKSFADAVLKQIQQLVSKIIATGIISLIGNLLAPGVGTVGGGAVGVLKRVGADILKSIGLGGKSVANPSFGGVGPGGLGMSGQVNVVLRGSDLVGALNRTNATINRVG